MLDDARSTRETEVLSLVATGCSNKHIGSALTISAETVKARIENILCKLGVRDRTHAVTAYACYRLHRQAAQGPLQYLV